MKRFLPTGGRRAWWLVIGLWAVLGVVIIGIVVLLVYLFAAPRGSTLPNSVTRNIRAIYREGRALGNQPDVFAKVGDSITVTEQFLTPIGNDEYDLGSYGSLQSVIDHYGGGQVPSGNPFNRRSLAAGVGWSAPAVLNPDFANKAVCQPDESPLVCEYRIAKPSVALIMLGTNDATFLTRVEYTEAIQQVIDASAAMGVIPVISTIPDQPERQEVVNVFNLALRELAQQNHIPLWDYHAALDDLPQGGISADGLHPVIRDNPAHFTPDNLQYGYPIRNLTALQMLAAVQGAVR
jgi:hypothetical protein